MVRLNLEKSSDGKPVGIWQSDLFADPSAMGLCTNAVLVAGKLANDAEDAKEQFAIVALDLRTGESVWKYELSSSPTNWGIAVDRNGQIVVTLIDGRVVMLTKDS